MAKARNRAVDATLTLPGITRPVGRPRKADSLTNAERQSRWRSRSDESFDSAELERITKALSGIDPALLSLMLTANFRYVFKAMKSVISNGNTLK